ncbi:MAG: ATP-binding protein [Ilumatobacteraceae bacterium]
MLSLTLRVKTMLVAGVVAALLSTAAAMSTYVLARQYMLEQRTDVAIAQVVAATRLASSTLGSGTDSLTGLTTGAQLLQGSRAALFRDGEWFVSGVGISPDDLPSSLLKRLSEGVPARQRFALRDEPAMSVGYPLNPESGSFFVGVLSLQELARTLNVLQGALAVGVALGTLGGGLIGLRLSHRVMEPLHAVGDTAVAISHGDLSHRVSEPKEPDLARIAQAFNGMTESLQVRIDREARFGATVSHELKSPLTVIRGAADLIASRRDELPSRAQLGSDLLTSQIDEFEKILNDLIEMSRYQSGTVRPQIEVLAADQLVAALANRHGLDQRQIEVDPVDVVVDVRRLEQIFVNLKRNADLYAGGIEAVRGERRDSRYLLHFDDAGIGVPVSEREKIFEPFTRGVQHSAVSGSGLGLAITREHARSMGGDIRADSSPEGGARFTLSLRIPPESADDIGAHS